MLSNRLPYDLTSEELANLLPNIPYRELTWGEARYGD